MTERVKAMKASKYATRARQRPAFQDVFVDDTLPWHRLVTRSESAAASEGTNVTIYHFEDGFCVFQGHRKQSYDIFFNKKTDVKQCDDCGAWKAESSLIYSYDTSEDIVFQRDLYLCRSCATRMQWHNKKVRLFNENQKAIKEIQNETRKQNRNSRTASQLSV